MNCRAVQNRYKIADAHLGKALDDLVGVVLAVGIVFSISYAAQRNRRISSFPRGESPDRWLCGKVASFSSFRVAFARGLHTIEQRPGGGSFEPSWASPLSAVLGPSPGHTFEKSKALVDRRIN
nr:hypothetical protein [Herbiconiux sp. KACC 21604]